jgi:hypothetical protein
MNTTRFLPLFLVILCLTACRTAYQTTGVVVHTVDAAMKGWGDWVRAGKATPTEEAAVKRAYQAYQQSMETAYAAYLAAQERPAEEPKFRGALAAADAAKNEVIKLVLLLTRRQP